MDSGEYNKISQQLKDLKELIETKFEQNEQAHQSMNDWLRQLNERTVKQEKWKNRQIPVIERWKKEEQTRKSKGWDFFIKLTGGIIVGVVLCIVTIALKAYF
ncbi:hypothetical protein AKJ56_00990 [candidate division MSBL1 archaeon SCGC-AAA382N08]|uniref:Uncharacterized protein n=1 Tax=candidate division MSBL1 archaeon SCGC-AAA382N08 TaxID=1698285 RepID=A0A133VQ25_9EURY|nr:hypothetical protein AKJ56_00990 [candidate division MSBL1 archaeon SCGC-AAA382N08]